MANLFKEPTMIDKGNVKVSKIRKSTEIKEQILYDILHIENVKTEIIHIKNIEEYKKALQECQEDKICSFDFETTITKKADEYYKNKIDVVKEFYTNTEKQLKKDIELFEYDEKTLKKVKNKYNKQLLGIQKDIDNLKAERLRTPLDPHMSEICTLSFTSKIGKAYVVFISHDEDNISIEGVNTPDKTREIVLNLFHEYILSSLNVLKVAYNLIFETMQLLSNNIYIAGPVSDPMNMGIRVYQIIKPGFFKNSKNPMFGFGLKAMTKSLFNHKMTEFNETIKDVEFFSQVKPVDAKEYAGEDSDYGLRHHYYYKHLAEQIIIDSDDIPLERPYKTYYDFLLNIDMPFTRVIGQMQFFGMHWNKSESEKLKKTSMKQYHDTINQLKSTIEEYIQSEYFKNYYIENKSLEEYHKVLETYQVIDVGKNAKTKLIKQFIFDVLDAPTAVLTKAGQASMGKDGILEIEYIIKNNLQKSSNEIYNENRIEYVHPHKDVLLELMEILDTIQKYSTLISAHLEGREKYLHPFTENIHAQFDMYAETGRLRSRRPNGQNIPRPDNDPLGIRNLYTPKPGKIYIMIDYDAFEMTIQSWYSKDQNMMNQINDGVDLHMLTAQASTGKDPKDITKIERTGAKITNFSQIYGGGASVIQKNLKKMYDIWLPIEECEKLAGAVKIAFPGINSYRDEYIAWAKQHNYIQTIFGFRRLLPFINSTNTFYRSSEERRAMNTPIQGSAADIMKRSQNKIYDMLANNTYPFDKARFAQVQQVHDEIVCEIDADDIQYLQDVVDAIQNIMCEPPLENFPVNISVGVSVAENGWGNKIDISKYIELKTKDVV